MKRILMYSQDGMGLGHLRRSANIAEEILTLDPSCDIVILADSPAAPLVPARHGLEVLKLPTLIKTGSDSWKSTNWRTATLSSSVRRIVRLRAELILQAFKEFRPHAVLVDHMPVGALGELKPMLAWAAEPRGTKFFLGLRDILDSPTIIRRAWRKLGGYDYLSRYNAVLVYGNRDMYDSTEAYGLLPGARRVVYCDYVSPRDHACSNELLEREPFLLMMGGGGHDAFRLASAFVATSARLSKELPGTRAVVLTGPNMSVQDLDALRKSAPPSVRIESGLGNAEEWIRAATAVVTLAGYNSMCEILKWHKKALVVPRAGPSAEQLTRSRLLSDRLLIRTIDPEALTPLKLCDELISLLGDDRIPNQTNIPPLHGAQRAATMLLNASAAGARRRRVRAEHVVHAPPAESAHE